MAPVWIWGGWAAATLLSRPAIAAPAAADPCPVASLQGDAGGGAARGRLTVNELATIEDIGPPNNELPGRALFSLSPDGKAIAFQVRRGDPASNRVCLAMLVVPLDGGTTIVADRGGALILYSRDSGAAADTPSGIPLVITPRWSPDGRWFAFLKRENGSTQVWRAARDGSGSAQITHIAEDVRDLRFSADGTKLLLQTRPAVTEARRAIEKEGLRGLHYDDRFMPGISNWPLPSSRLPMTVSAVDVQTGAPVPAAATDWDGARREPEEFASENLVPAGRDATVRLAAGSDRGYPRRSRLQARMADGRIVTCPDATCATFDQLIGWSADGRRMRYLRHEGWAFDTTAVYEWLPGDKPRRLFATNDYLPDCRPIAEDLLCARETPTEPRHIVRIALGARKPVLVFDPEPRFHALTMGKVELLEWRNDLGVESYGRLVYPVGYQPQRRYPMIVVTYIARGFLRGGTGDEFPIHAFAGAGYAVLVIQNPMPQIALARFSLTDVDHEILKDFRQRRSILSSIEVESRALIARGIVDPARIGIAGLSDGSSTVQFAGINSSLFKAASMGSCCWEPTQDALLGPDTAKMYTDIGWPELADPDPKFWRRMSWMLQPERVSFPVLMQLSDEEYLGGLESYTALAERARPVDLFVFPDEHHVKWQPAHRLALYQRNLDWFDFWLKDQDPVSSLSRDDGKRWKAMRATASKRDAQGSGSPGLTVPHAPEFEAGLRAH